MSRASSPLAFNALATEVARLPEQDRQDAVEALTTIGATLIRDLSALAPSESLTADDLGVSRQQLKHLRDGGKLVALRFAHAPRVRIPGVAVRLPRGKRSTAFPRFKTRRRRRSSLRWVCIC